MARIAEHYVEISAKVDKLDKALQKGQSKLSKFSGIATKLSGVLAGAFAVDKLIRFGAEAQALASKAEGISAAFAGLNRPELLDNLRNAVRGTVDDVSLMQAAVKAQNFKVPLEKLGTFFQFATNRAIQTGESVDYLVESIINGIGRKSSLVLDNLGISASELQDEIKKTGDFGAAAGNIIERELAKAGKVADTTATRTARWGATMKNIQVTIGQGINRALNALAPIIDKAFKGLVDVIPKIRAGLVSMINYFISLYNESMLFRGIIQGLGVAFKTLWGIVKLVFKNMLQSFKNLGTAVKLLFTGNFDEAFESIKQSFKQVGNNYAEFGKDFAENYQKAFLETMYQRKPIELVGLDDATQNAVIQQAATFGGKVGQALSESMQGLGMGVGPIGPGETPDVNQVPIPGFSEEALNNLVSNFGTAFETIGGYMTGLFEGFASAFTTGENVLQQFLDYFKKWALGIIAQIAAIAAAAAVLSMLLPGAGFGGIFKGLFGQSSLGGLFSAGKSLGDTASLATTIGGGGINMVIEKYNKNKANSF